MIAYDEWIAWILLERDVPQGAWRGHCRWSNDPQDWVFLGWGDDFRLVPRYVRDQRGMPLSEKRRYTWDPTSIYASSCTSAANGPGAAELTNTPMPPPESEGSAAV